MENVSKIILFNTNVRFKKICLNTFLWVFNSTNNILIVIYISTAIVSCYAIDTGLTMKLLQFTELSTMHINYETHALKLNIWTNSIYVKVLFSALFARDIITKCIINNILIITIIRGVGEG